MHQYSEQEIIDGCRKNKRLFQELLYKGYYSLFMKICARYAMNMEDAEQLANDGFLRIFKHIGGYKHNGSFEGWMKRIVINNCLDYLKSRQLKDARQLAPATTTNYENTCNTYDAEALQRLAFKDLLNIIQTLPTVSKTVFNLYVFDGYSHKEIATIMSITEGTSSWHVHHARHLLQKKITRKNEETLPYEK